MKPPFTSQQFYAIFIDYNDGVWPAQIMLLALAILAFAFVFKSNRRSSTAVSAILGLLWAWSALAYHLTFFSRISPLAYAFAAVSLLGAGVFFLQGVLQQRLAFRWQAGTRSFMGLTLVVFAVLVYPIWSIYAGHSYPEMPTFGLPCPTTIFTIGMLAFVTPPVPRSAIVVPFLWCLVGTQAAFFLDIQADFGLVAAALVALGLCFTAHPPLRKLR